MPRFFEDSFAQLSAAQQRIVNACSRRGDYARDSLLAKLTAEMEIHSSGVNPVKLLWIWLIDVWRKNRTMTILTKLKIV